MMNKKLLISTLILSGFSLSISAQEALDKIHIGVKGGLNASKATYSELKYRDTKFLMNGMGGIFMEFETGENGFFSIRPEVDFLSRGIKISDSDLDYRLKAKYTDFRVPLIFNFGNREGIRPYVYVAPIVGFVRGGDIRDREDGIQYELDVTDANMASTYFAGAIGAGVKFPIAVGDNRIHVGVEANYQLGFTDTYSKKEKNGEAWAVNRPIYLIEGNRRLNSFEISATVSVPLSIFKRKPKKQPEPVYVPEPVVPVQPEPVVKEELKPCYTLEEILAYIEEGESIVGKTICAVDMIHFEFDKSRIKEESYPYLDKIVDLMCNTDIHITIKGHTDGIGNADYNMELSRKRAEAVYNYLTTHGVKASHLKYEYYGMTQPIAPNATEEGRLQNRRVEFEITQ